MAAISASGNAPVLANPMAFPFHSEGITTAMGPTFTAMTTATAITTVTQTTTATAINSAMTTTITPIRTRTIRWVQTPFAKQRNKVTDPQAKPEEKVVKTGRSKISISTWSRETGKDKHDLSGLPWRSFPLVFHRLGDVFH